MPHLSLSLDSLSSLSTSFDSFKNRVATSHSVRCLFDYDYLRYYTSNFTVNYSSSLHCYATNILHFVLGNRSILIMTGCGALSAIFLLCIRRQKREKEQDSRKELISSTDDVTSAASTGSFTREKAFDFTKRISSRAPHLRRKGKSAIYI